VPVPNEGLLAAGGELANKNSLHFHAGLRAGRVAGKNGA
jgi:hypothetical protein